MASARSTQPNTANPPSATHGSGRRPRLNGIHQVPKASTASQPTTGRRANRPSRGSTHRLSSSQVASPSSTDGSRSHPVDEDTTDHWAYSS